MIMIIYCYLYQKCYAGCGIIFVTLHVTMYCFLVQFHPTLSVVCLMITIIAASKYMKTPWWNHLHWMVAPWHHFPYGRPATGSYWGSGWSRTARPLWKLSPSVDINMMLVLSCMNRIHPIYCLLTGTWLLHNRVFLQHCHWRDGKIWLCIAKTQLNYHINTWHML